MSTISLSNRFHTPYTQGYKWRLSFYYEAIVRLLLLLFVSFVASAQTAKISYGLSPSKKVQYEKIEWTVRVVSIDKEPTKSTVYWWLQNDFANNRAANVQIGMQPNDSLFKGKSAFMTFAVPGAVPVSGNCKMATENGKGVNCRIAYDWDPGVPYKMTFEQNNTATTPDNFKRWIATIVNGQTGDTKQIGEVDVPISWGNLNPSSNCFAQWKGLQGTPPCNSNSPFEIVSSAPVGFIKGQEVENKFIGHSEKSPCAEFKVIDEHTVSLREK